MEFQRTGRARIMEAIAEVNGGAGGGDVVSSEEDGAVRMRIVVKKQDLKRMLELVRTGGRKNQGAAGAIASAEQQLNLMMQRRQISRASQGKDSCRRAWRPALQSIPEEF